MTDLPDAPNDPCAVDALLDIISDPALRIDAAWTITHLNGAAQELWGRALAPGTDLRTYPTVRYLTTPTGEPVNFADARLARLLVGGEPPQSLEFTLRLPDQTPRQLRVSSVPLGRDGANGGAVLIIQPFTTYRDLQIEVMARDRSLQGLNDLAVRLGRLNTVNDVYQTALDGLLVLLGSGVGAVLRVDPAGRGFLTVAHHGYHAATVEKMERLSNEQAPILRRASETGEIFVVHPGTPGALAEIALAGEQMQTAVVVPVLQGTSVGVLLVYLLEAHREIASSEREVLRTAATHIAAALERARLDEQVRRQAAATQAEYERLATIIANVDISLAMLDATGHIVLVNDTWLRRRGETRQHVMGRRYGELVENPTISGTQEAVDQVLATGEPVVVHDFLLPGPTPARDLYVDWSILPLRAPDGAITGAINISVDVTEKVRARQQIEDHHGLLTTLFESTPVGIILYDHEMRVVNVNMAHARMARIAIADMLGKVIYEFSPVAENRRTTHERVLAGEPMDLDVIAYRHPDDGEMRYYDIRYRPVRGAGGVVTGILSTTIDVTAQVQAQQQLENQRALLETMVAAAPVGIAFFDRDMRIVTLNAEWARMSGTDLIAARGQILYDVLPNMRARQAAHQRALSGEAVDLDDVLYDLPGEDRPRHYEVHFRPIWDKDGAIAGTLVAASDVTARHEIDQQKDEFIALASHELKTPVTAIKGYAQSGLRAATKLGDERLERTLRVIDDQSNRLTRLINELLDVSRAQSNTLSLYAEPLDLRQLVHEVVNNLQLTAPAFTLDLQVPPRPTVVNADRQRIEQVLVNLVQNAIKYSGQSERVEISVRTEGSEVITTVRDFGVGIPLDQQEQVFERFFRARNVSSRHYSGLGLGLFIARGIVERQGGRMWLQSVEGSGSTFAFALPLLPTNE
jgi:PAS domain S-box-containing protein